jgi:gamma-tubulin complex component 2
MVRKIMYLSEHYDRITNFINLNCNIETGLICKGLCEGLRKIIREYLLFVNQLEAEYNTDNLDIQKLWYLCQPSLKVLDNLNKLTYQASLVKGGALLNILYSFLQNTTDSELKKLFKVLLDKAIEPYFEMLKLWVCKGFLNDRFGEFMVLWNKNYTVEILGEYYYDLFWEKKFVMSNNNTPEFFNNFAEKVFFIGKTLNILRECNKVVNCPYEKEFESFLNKNNSIFESDILINFQNLINKIYEWANITLKNLLFKEENLNSIFKSIKKFYFMECGDFYTHLLDCSDELLLIERNKIKFEKFENLIDNAIRSTSANLDFNKELFDYKFSNMILTSEKSYLERYNKALFDNNDMVSLVKSLNELNNDKNLFQYEDSNIIEALVLEMNVKWPLNLIFNKKIMLKYKILFRQLLFLKFQEKKLSESWMLQQNFKDFKFQNLLKPSYLLRDKMINFVKNITYYFFNEVIEPNYINFINSLVSSKSIDDIINSHESFLNICLKECLIDNSDLLNSINTIIQTCLVYSRVIIKYYNSAVLNEKYINNMNQSPVYKYRNKYERMKENKLEKDKILEEIFIKQKFLNTVEKFINSFENRMEQFLSDLSKM